MIVFVDENGQFTAEPPKHFVLTIENSEQQKPNTK